MTRAAFWAAVAAAALVAVMAFARVAVEIVGRAP